VLLRLGVALRLTVRVAVAVNEELGEGVPLGVDEGGSPSFVGVSEPSNLLGLGLGFGVTRPTVPVTVAVLPPKATMVCCLLAAVEAFSVDGFFRKKVSPTATTKKRSAPSKTIVSRLTRIASGCPSNSSSSSSSSSKGFTAPGASRYGSGSLRSSSAKNLFPFSLEVAEEKPAGSKTMD